MNILSLERRRDSSIHLDLDHMISPPILKVLFGCTGDKNIAALT